MGITPATSSKIKYTICIILFLILIIIYNLSVSFLLFSFKDLMGEITWRGAGPHECYADRKESSIQAIHCAPIDELHVPYIRPGENGSRCDVNFLQLSKNEKIALSLPTEKTLSLSIQEIGNKCNGSFTFSVSNYSIDELNAAMHWSTMENHRMSAGAVSQENFFFLHIDPYTMGVGGDDSWTACVHKEFLLPPDLYEFSLLLSPSHI